MAGEREKMFGFADMIVIYPATAHTIGKIAHGLADNAVTAISMVSLGSKVPFVIIPAMHDSMFRNPIYQENVEKLKKLGVAFLGPRLEENKAKIANVEDVVQYILNFYQNKKKDFQNKKILITYGATREWIDDVRFLSNPATGKSGQVIAQELVARGAEVTIMKGPNSVPAPMGTKVINFISTEDCAKSIKEELNNNHYDVLISTAAFADFKIIVRMDGKIKSNSPNLTLHLENTPKVIKTARETQPDLFIVAYKAESSLTEEELISKAAKYMEKGNYNLIVANSVHPSLPDQGFAGDKNDVFIIDPEKNVLKSGYKYKTEIATLLLDTLRKKLT
jgi:phosphopantothenoylcysteine decarboxylase/phosphopantothenate--cysteine ligase